jgi:hypothetical protein
MDPAQLMQSYLAKGVLIDTNLLVLLAVGLYRPDRISTFNRTRQYTVEDFDLVANAVNRFNRRVTTPHILAEADNLTRQLSRRERSTVSIIMARLISDSFEIYSPSADAVRHDQYSNLGLTDTVTIAASKDVLVITDDFPLSNVLSHLGRDAININHFRNYIWA